MVTIAMNSPPPMLLSNFAREDFEEPITKKTTLYSGKMITVRLQTRSNLYRARHKTGVGSTYHETVCRNLAVEIPPRWFLVGKQHLLPAYIVTRTWSEMTQIFDNVALHELITCTFNSMLPSTEPKIPPPRPCKTRLR